MLKRIAQLLLAPTAEGGGTATMDPAFAAAPNSSSWIATLKPEFEPPTDDAQAKAAAAAESKAKADADAKAKADAETKAKSDAAAAPPAEVKKTAEPADKSAADSKIKTDASNYNENDPVPHLKADWDKFKSNRAEVEKNLQSEVKARDTQIAELNTRIAEFEEKLSAAPAADPATDAKLKQQEKLIEEMSATIQRLDVREEPRFKAHYEERIKSVIDDAKSVVGNEKAAQVERLLKLEDSDWKNAQVNEFMADLDDVAKVDLRVIMRDLKKIEADRQGDMKKAESLRTQHQEQLKNQRGAAIKAFQDAFSNELKVLQDPDPKKGMVPFQKRAIEGTDEEQAQAKAWNDSVDQRVAKAKAILETTDVKPRTIARTALDAAALPIVVQTFQAKMNEWAAEKAQFEKTIKELTAAQTAGGRAGGGEGGARELKSSATKDMNPMQRSNAWAKDMADAMNSGLGT